MKSGDEQTSAIPVQTAQLPDLEQLASNTAKLVEEMGKATAAALKPVEEGRAKPAVSEEVGDLVKTLGQVVEHWAMDPQRVVLAQTSLTKGFLDLWTCLDEADSGGACTARRRAGSIRQALPRSGMVGEPVLRLHQASLSHHVALG